METQEARAARAFVRGARLPARRPVDHGAGTPEQNASVSDIHRRLWAIVLAGGEGKRLRPLVRHVHGDERPKQFATLIGTRSLLRQTLDRAALAVPRDHLVVIASRSHRRYVDEEFAGSPAPRVLVQPADRGTAAGILYPAHWIRARHPEAIVAVLPADHFIARESAFMNHVAAVAEWASSHADSIVLLAARPTRAETEYGWIEPAETIASIPSGTIRRVWSFREKPSPEEARSCFQRGCLWNTFIMIASVSALTDACRVALPQLHSGLGSAVRFGRDDAGAIESAYAEAPAADFSRSILTHCPSSLAVSELPAVGWSDWGTSERVMRSLKEAGLEPSWLRRPLPTEPPAGRHEVRDGGRSPDGRFAYLTSSTGHRASSPTL